MDRAARAELNITNRHGALSAIDRPRASVAPTSDATMSHLVDKGLRAGVNQKNSRHVFNDAKGGNPQLRRTMPPGSTRARAPAASSIQAKISSIRSIRNRPLTVVFSSAALRRMTRADLYRLTSATAAESVVL